MEQPHSIESFFGNSAVVSAFREGQSISGYAELGLNWGKAQLQYMLERGYITINESLVMGLNIFTLMDVMVIVWMPYNPYSPKSELYGRVMERANAIFVAYNLEVIDLTYAFSRENFHDTGHFNDEVGAVNFTREIDLWI